MLLDGCAVGIVSVRTPERLPAAAPPPLPYRVSFDACARMDSEPLANPLEVDRIRGSQRKWLADRVRMALISEGIEAELVAKEGSPARFTVTEDEVELKHGWSFLLSMFTFSVVPGYLEEVHRLQVSLSEPGSRDTGRIAHLQ